MKNKKLSKIQIVRSVLCLPFFFIIVFGGVIINDVTGILDYYYPLFRQNHTN